MINVSESPCKGFFGEEAIDDDSCVNCCACRPTLTGIRIKWDRLMAVQSRPECSEECHDCIVTKDAISWWCAAQTTHLMKILFEQWGSDNPYSCSAGLDWFTRVTVTFRPSGRSFNSNTLCEIDSLLVNHVAKRRCCPVVWFTEVMLLNRRILHLQDFGGTGHTCLPCLMSNLFLTLWLCMPSVLLSEFVWFLF